MAGENGTQEEQAGVDLAYNLMQNSYDLAVSRLNAVENRIQAVMVFSASFIVTVPVLIAATGNTIALATPLFYVAATIAGTNLLIGTLTRALGEVKLPRIYLNPREWLGLHAYWFKFYAVEDATQHFKDNLRTVNRNGLVAIIMTGLFLAETVLLAVWGFSQIV